MERADAAARKAASQHEKEAKAQQTLQRSKLVEHQNAELQTSLATLRSYLVDSLSRASRFSFSSLKTVAAEPTFIAPNPPSGPAPRLEAFLPTAPRGVASHLPGAKRKYQEEVTKAKAALEGAQHNYEDRQQAWKDAVGAAQADHAARLAKVRED